MGIYVGTKELQKIYYGGPTTESDMKGPCPTGFHVPTESELTSITSAGQSMGAWTYKGGINISIYLKMPHAGIISSSGTVASSGDIGYYWTCTAVNGNNTAKMLQFYKDTASQQVYGSPGRMTGGKIRPFKNTSVSPDSTRTRLYGSLTSGIFWNSTLGLISIVYNGNTYTIADKNLGATTVYNYGDTLSADNCGGFFQWGNNYMFPYSGPTKTSTTRVSAADYGPGNYYSSDTFIYSSNGYNIYWDTSNNLNLWGGTTQGTFQFQREVKAIYLGTTQIRPSYKREPGANTTGYFKFNGNLKDEISGTTYTASGITYGTLPNGNQYAIFPGNSNGRFAYNTNISGGGNELTLHVWFQVANTSNMRTEFSGAQNGYNYYTSFIWESGNIGIYYYDTAHDIANGGAWNIQSYNINERHLFSQTIKAGGKIKIFLDGNLGYEKNMEATLRNGGDGGQYIGARRNGSSNYFNGKMSEMIMENRERTEQEVSDYYNRTKGNYGL